jgi:hypothetical protein
MASYNSSPNSAVAFSAINASRTTTASVTESDGTVMIYATAWALRNRLVLPGPDANCMRLEYSNSPGNCMWIISFVAVEVFMTASLHASLTASVMPPSTLGGYSGCI